MQDKIHPEVVALDITCSCGNVFEGILTTMTNRKAFNIEVCSKCHPFYTGLQKIVDTAGRVERMNTKYGRILTSGLMKAGAPKEKDS